MKKEEKEIGRNLLTNDVVNAMDDLDHLAKMFREDPSLDEETRQKILARIQQAEQEFAAIVDRLDKEAQW
ncbi:MAG: hypothetical protein LW808_001810 [Verrucomicrobiota bacterium]|nr:MAG: hypothetical protein LW808_001810 [Verrucomicrobiota bacterium]